MAKEQISLPSCNMSNLVKYISKSIKRKALGKILQEINHAIRKLRKVLHPDITHNTITVLPEFKGS